ncbi:DsbA-like protein, partial [Opisthorchis viverrini]
MLPEERTRSDPVDDIFNTMVMYAYPDPGMRFTTRPKVLLYFDIVSPYSWIGFETACRYSQRWPVNFRFVPAYLGGIMHESGNKPPGMVPARGRYMVKDLARLASHYQIPLKWNDNVITAMFDKRTVDAQRLLIAVALDSTDTLSQSSRPESVVSAPPGSLLETVARNLWLRIWSTGEDITTTDSHRVVLQTALPDKPSEWVDSVLQKASSTVVKDLLKSNTKAALDLGAFGLPTFDVQVEGESHMVFGSDRFHIIADLVGKLAFEVCYFHFDENQLTTCEVLQVFAQIRTFT